MCRDTHRHRVLLLRQRPSTWLPEIETHPDGGVSLSAGYHKVIYWPSRRRRRGRTRRRRERGRGVRRAERKVRVGEGVKLSGLSLGDLAMTPDINLQSSSDGNRALICRLHTSTIALHVLFPSLLAPAAAAFSFEFFTMRISSLHAGGEMPITPKPLSPR